MLRRAELVCGLLSGLLGLAGLIYALLAPSSPGATGFGFTASDGRAGTVVLSEPSESLIKRGLSPQEAAGLATITAGALVAACGAAWHFLHHGPSGQKGLAALAIATGLLLVGIAMDMQRSLAAGALLAEMSSLFQGIPPSERAVAWWAVFLPAALLAVLANAAGWRREWVSAMADQPDQS